jgi:hypothetical protein
VNRNVSAQRLGGALQESRAALVEPVFIGRGATEADKAA